ncbi:MAG TPA: L-histidine N(alpha)-methyltransferase [Tepidisphaeraceae bacterium]|jgi:dimethylhistidine N-methyltransferase|nr:L-histidine N(alpha)-methyltransferase [Tepidisphaeraceae bacterium]
MSICTDPTSSTIAPPALHDCGPRPDDFRAAVREGLSANAKSLPCKFFYDRRGSELFDRICRLPEYYPTRTELAITRRHAGHMAQAIGPVNRLVEYGSGSSIKTRLLLDSLDLASYVPIDISREHLLHSASRLAERYPAIAVQPVCADYTADFSLPPLPTGDFAAEQTLAYFPGSTIGNFEPAEAVAFLQSVRDHCGPGSGLLIGVDLKKDPARLHAAYNDAQGVTAAFNLNLLTRINRELAGNINLDAFAHYAGYNVDRGRVEMRLVSLASQTLNAAGTRFNFDEGEGIFTESCYKYTLDGFESLAADAGYRVHSIWLDDDRLFSVQYLRGA